MTSTSVKNVGAALMNLTVSQTNKGAAGAGGFQKVWNGQMSKGASDNGVQNNAKSQTGRQVQKGSSLKAKEGQTARENVRKTSETLSPEEQERAAEVLGAAALNLMDQIMDAFGVGEAELQAAMAEIGMEQTDVLDASALSALLMKLGGAEDPYALVTDGELYENYRMLMQKMGDAVSESAESLGADPEQLIQLLDRGLAEEPEMNAAEALIDVQKAAGTTEQSGSVQTDAERTEDGLAETGNGLTAGITEEAVSKNPEAENQTGGRQEGERQSDGKTERGQQFNLFVQNLGTEPFQPGLQQTGDTAHSSPWSTDTQEIMNQILDYMKLQLNADSTSLEMQLHPASLGTLQVQIASKGGVVTANFITQNEAVKAALETQMIQLKAQFEEQGVKVEAIEVTVQTHEFERNLDEQGRGRGGQEQASGRRNRTRRIDLNDPLSLAAMEDEDTLTAELMAADGSTVNYTV